MASHVENLSLKVQYALSPTSSICSERSTPSPDSGLECNQSQSSESNFLQLRPEEQLVRRKLSTSSEASYVSTNLSYDGGFSDRPTTPDELLQSPNKYDEIVEKIGHLKFSPRNSNLNLNDPEISYNFVNAADEPGETDNNSSDDDLQERGPDIKNKNVRRKPYEPLKDWLDSSSMDSLDYSAQLINCGC